MPSVTQATMNARMRDTANNFNLKDTRVSNVGGLVVVDGFLNMEPQILITMATTYVHSGLVYSARTMCLHQNPPVLTVDHLKAARLLFDTLKVIP
jgi:hypothetical protein